MELRWLESFSALARARHFSRAAEEQNVSQPTFSRRIKLLEEQMGVMLIDRNTLPLTLTPAGKLFLEASENIIRILRSTREQCLDLERAETEKLNFATTQSLYLNFYQGWYDGLSTDLEVTLDLKSTAWIGKDFVHALQVGDCDLILCYWHPAIDFMHPLESEDYEYLTLAEDVLVPVTALNAQGEPKFSLPGTRRYPLSYISYNAMTFINPVINDHLRRRANPAYLLPVNENSQANSVKAMISQGYGVGWLPQREFHRGGTHGLVPAGDATWQIPVELRIFRSRQNSHPSIELLWQSIERQLR